MITIRQLLLIVIFLLPAYLFGQVGTPDLTKAYTQAIADFIKAANQKNKSAFDTLFIAKRHNGQPDDFPDITLPANISHTQIKLVEPEKGKQLMKERPSRIYINLMGWMNKEKAEFIFVVFSKGFAHQYDYTINYTYNQNPKALILSEVKFKGPPFDK